jgi:hypothetical protein
VETQYFASLQIDALDLAFFAYVFAFFAVKVFDTLRVELLRSSEDEATIPRAALRLLGVIHIRRLRRHLLPNNATINNQQSTINNQQSTINNRKSTIVNQQS